MASSYEVIVVGGGVHGLSTAYNLAKRGLKNVLVVEKKRVGVGASGRNGECVRSSFACKEWIALHTHSLNLWQTLSAELDFNVMFSSRGYLVCAGNEHTWNALPERVATQRSLGLKTKIVDRKQILEIVPAVNPDSIYGGGFYQSDAGNARHDGTVWGYTKAAKRLGVTIKEFCPVEDFIVEKGKIQGIITPEGRINCERLVLAAGISANDLARKMNVELNLISYLDEAIVTEPLKPYIPCGFSNPDLMTWITQTARGETVCGSHWDKDKRIDAGSSNTSKDTMSVICRNLATIFPGMAGAKVMRAWSGGISYAVDYSPILGTHPDVEGLVLNCGWGGYGFMSCPGSGDVVAESMVSGKIPEVMRPFGFERFAQNKLLHEGSIISD